MDGSDHDVLIEVRNDVKHLTGKVENILEQMAEARQEYTSDRVDREKLDGRLTASEKSVNDHLKTHQNERNKLLAIFTALASGASAFAAWLINRF